LVDLVQLVTERLVGAADSDRYQDIASSFVISRTIRWLRLVELQSTALKRKPSKSTFASWNLALKIRSLAIHFSDSTLSKRKSVPYKCVLMGHYFLDDDAGAITDLQGWCNIRSCAPSTHINAFFVLLCGNRFIASSTRCCQSTETNDTDLDNLCLTLLNFGRIDEDRLEAWIELVILRHLTGRDDEEIQQQPAGSSTTMVVRSDTEEEENCPQCRKFFREIRPSGWNIFPSKT
jgi:hypothetical protein